MAPVLLLAGSAEARGLASSENLKFRLLLLFRLVISFKISPIETGSSIYFLIGLSRLSLIDSMNKDFLTLNKITSAFFILIFASPVSSFSKIFSRLRPLALGHPSPRSSTLLLRSGSEYSLRMILRLSGGCFGSVDNSRQLELRGVVVVEDLSLRPSLRQLSHMRGSTGEVGCSAFYEFKKKICLVLEDSINKINQFEKLPMFPRQYS